MADEFTERYADLLAGSYDCVYRIVLNAYFPLRAQPGPGSERGGGGGMTRATTAWGQRAPDAVGRPVRPPGTGIGGRARHTGDRLPGRRTQAPHRRGARRGLS